jgi:hypothetical protein
MLKQFLSPLGLTAFFVATMMGGCTTARMESPANMPATVSEMPVKGRMALKFDESFSFGSYDVFDVQRGWRVTTAWGAFGFDSSKARQTYEFKIKSRNQLLSAHCATDVKWRSMEFSNFLNSGGSMNFELNSDLVFACTFTEKKSGQMWRLVMNQDTQNIVMNGALTGRNFFVSVEGTQKLSGSSMPLLDPTGYYFRKAGKPIGSVEVINSGTVQIDSHQPNSVQSALAAASAALLLYQDLK